MVGPCRLELQASRSPSLRLFRRQKNKVSENWIVCAVHV